MPPTGRLPARHKSMKCSLGLSLSLLPALQFDSRGRRLAPMGRDAAPQHGVGRKGAAHRLQAGRSRPCGPAEPLSGGNVKWVAKLGVGPMGPRPLPAAGSSSGPTIPCPATEHIRRPGRRPRGLPRRADGQARVGPGHAPAAGARGPAFRQRLRRLLVGHHRGESRLPGERSHRRPVPGPRRTGQRQRRPVQGRGRVPGGGRRRPGRAAAQGGTAAHRRRHHLALQHFRTVGGPSARRHGLLAADPRRLLCTSAPATASTAPRTRCSIRWPPV